VSTPRQVEDHHIEKACFRRGNGRKSDSERK
jgi:hypothetical protein